MAKGNFYYKLLYTLGGIVFGLILAALAFGTLSGIFWSLFNQKPAWPGWTRPVLIAAFILVFIIVFWFFVKRGIKKDILFNETGQPINKPKKLVLSLSILFTGLFLFGAFFYFGKIIKKQKETVSAGRISNIELSQADDNMLLIVDVIGEQKGGFRLSIAFETISYTHDPLLSMTHYIMLLKGKHRFHFFIPFKEISDAYHKILEDYIPRYKGDLNIDEDIKMVISLSRAQYRPLKEEELEMYVLHSEAGIIQFSFICNEQSCRIVQEEPPEEQEETSDN